MKTRSAPDLVRKEGLAVLISFAALCLLAGLIDAPLDGPADTGGIPSDDVKAPWIFVGIQFMLRHINLGTRLGKHNARSLMSAPVLVVLSAEKDDAISQIKIGQLYERIALTATKLGLSVQPLSQILEIPSQRQELASLLPDSRFLPQHFFRLGYTARLTASTPRRPVQPLVN